jgi:cobalt/nickel transport system permease protein
MHIPDGFLTPRVWVPLDIVSIGAVSYALRRISEVLEEKAIPLMGVLAAFVFAAQMLNIPVGGGTSGHFLGGALAGALLGPWGGLTVMTVVLIVQCFLFQDGGLAALGTNIFNMGILGAMGGAFIYRTLARIRPQRGGHFAAGFIAGWLAMVVSAVSCASQLAISGVVTWRAGVWFIVGSHALLGFIEGAVTGSVLQALSRSRPDLLDMPQFRVRRNDWLVWGCLLTLVIFLVPYASKSPDAVQRLLNRR